MPKRELRFTVPLSIREMRLMQKAAKITGERPAAFGRECIKRVSRQILTKAGVTVRLDMDDLVGAEDAPGSLEEE